MARFTAKPEKESKAEVKREAAMTPAKRAAAERADTKKGR